VRVFVAVNLPPALRTSIHDDTSALRGAAPGVSWTRADNLHLTLKFLGDVDEHGVARLRTALRPVTARHDPFSLRIAGLGAFPNFGRPRVVWIGVTRSHQLSALWEDVEQACALLGFERDARGFTGHITLGRVRLPMPRSAARTLELAAGAVPNEYVAGIASADLMSSEPAPGGSRYSVLTRLWLANASRETPPAPAT
jgi:2'-5' RNA ligase